MKGAKHILLSLTFLSSIFLVKAHDPGENALGKSEPVLHGSIVDAVTKKPVAGVVVSIVVSRTNEKKEITSDVNGNFKLPRMASGEVTLVLEKKGYRTIRRERIFIREGMSLKLDLDLRSESNGEDIDFFHPMMRMLEGS
ncbi:MAG: carboxypeptidase-like regulatory domain-containing protein [Flavitalea sp.]